MNTRQRLKRAAVRRQMYWRAGASRRTRIEKRYSRLPAWCHSMRRESAKATAALIELGRAMRAFEVSVVDLLSESLLSLPPVPAVGVAPAFGGGDEFLAVEALPGVEGAGGAGSHGGDAGG